MKYLLPIILLAIGMSSCSKTIYPLGVFQQAKAPVAPDYSKSYFWAALPNKEDKADVTPKRLKNEQACLLYTSPSPRDRG